MCVCVRMQVLVHASGTLKAIMVLSQRDGINYHMPTSSSPSVCFFLNPIFKKKKKKCINLLQLSSAQSTNVSEDFKKTYFVSIVYP